MISKIYEYIEDEEKTALLICNFALANKSFFEFFTQPQIWEVINKEGNYALLKGGDGVLIWESADINEWYGNIISSKDDENKRVILPADIWRHRKILYLVFEHLNVECAPSREDCELYKDDKVFSLLFLDHMASGDCFLYLSSELRSKEAIVLPAVKKFGRLIVHCTESLLNNREFIKKAVTVNGECLEFLAGYREDLEIALIASRTAENAGRWCPYQLKKDLHKVVLYSKPASDKRCWLCERKPHCYHGHDTRM